MVSFPDGIELREVPNYPGYFVTRDGYVWSTKCSRRNRKQCVWMNRCYDKDNYIIVNIASCHMAVHRLVMLAYGPPAPFEGAVIRHRDGNNNNNHIDNLHWGTVMQNVHDTFMHRTTEEERNDKAAHHVKKFLEALGHVTQVSEGLRDTPKRVTKAFREMLSGYGADPATILKTTFKENYDEMVVLRDIQFVSLCEHHMLPFTGTAMVGYIPNDGVVGISKLARLVECFAKRLQVQERMTKQIAEALTEHLEPLGCGVVMTAHHSCMSCRGVKQLNTEMITSAMRGVFIEPQTRYEFLSFNKS